MLATGFPKYREYLNFQTAAIYQALSSNVQAIRYTTQRCAHARTIAHDTRARLG